MPIDYDYIEMLYRIGKLPDRYYRQLNNKSLQQNYIEAKAVARKELQMLLDEQKNRIEEQRTRKELEQQIDDQISEVVQKSLDDILSSLTNR